MLRFSANLSLLFTEYPWLERFRVAGEQGFQAIEIQFPYHLPAEQILAALQENRLQLALFNVDADTLLQGGEGLAAVPDKRKAFKTAVAQTLAYAKILQPYAINVLPGRCLDTPRLPEYLQTFKQNLLYAAETFAPLGIKTVFEAVNSRDMPGFIISSSQAMLDIQAELRHPMLGLQYDIYHMTMMGEDCAGFLQQHADKIHHIQFADCPGRHQPGTGLIHFTELFNLIATGDYQGWVGAEYHPQGLTTNSLDWFKDQQNLESR